LDSRLSLPVNTVLDASYRIVRLVGSGGFGITYEAEDINLGTLVAIKEYYPFDFGDRDATMSVKPKSDRHRQTFDWGRSNFLQEARTLARFEHPSIVRVTRVFEANSTAYMVMRFEQGHSFESWLNSLGRPPTQEELDSIVAPLLDALQMMHAENFLHRDIAPDNIIVRADGTPVLLDFGAARRAVAEMSRTMTGIVKAGYSPHEQYSSDSRLQGPWSDLYALGGTLYRAVTGTPPEEATLRVDEDHMPPASQLGRRSGYRPGFLSAIDACLKVRHSERPRSVAQLRPMMLGRKSQSRPGLDRFVGAFKAPSKPALKTPSRPPSRPPLSPRTRRTVPPAAQPSVRRWAAIAAAIVAVMGGAYGGYEFSRWQPADSAEVVAAKKRAEEFRRQQEERLAEERARQEAEAAHLAQAEASRRKAEEERSRQEAEARRLAEAAAAKKAEEERVRQEAEAKRLAEAAAARKRAEEERARQEAQAKRLADAEAARKRMEEEQARQEAEAEAARKKAEDERARQEAEARRLAEATAARKKAEEERARQEAEARRLAEAEAARKKADEERARQAAEAKRLAEVAAAKKKAEDEERARQAAEAKRLAEVAAARKKDEEAARRVAELEKSKTGPEPERVAFTTLNAEERASFVKRIQTVLRDSKCYAGDIDGKTDDAQKGLDRYVKTARLKGKQRPGRIELAKATGSDFDSWLKDADDIKGSLCAPPPVKREEAKSDRSEEPKRRKSAEPRPPRSYPGGGGGGGGRVGPIQGIQ
jgi:serine/threonine protein kinase